MCSINHDLEIIFIHTPKCGGLFIEKVLEDFYGFDTYYFTHENHDDFVIKNLSDKDEKSRHGFLNINNGGVLRYYMTSEKHNLKMNMNYDKWKKYKKIAVLRNPYDRFISGFKYLNSLNKNLKLNITKHDGCENEVLDQSFVDSIKYKITETITDRDNISLYDFFHLFITQYEHLIDMDNEINIDYFIKFENLNRQLCEVLLKIGIDKIKHRKALLNNIKINDTNNANFYNFYDDTTLQFVNNYFEKDFQTFGFKKANNLNELFLESKQYHKTIEDFISSNISLLIELDEKQQILNIEQVCEQASNIMSDSKIQDIPINNKITLPNGLVLDTTQPELIQKQTRGADFHLTNFFELLKKFKK